MTAVYLSPRKEGKRKITGIGLYFQNREWMLQIIIPNYSSPAYFAVSKIHFRNWQYLALYMISPCFRVSALPPVPFPPPRLHCRLPCSCSTCVVITNSNQTSAASPSDFVSHFPSKDSTEYIVILYVST